MAQMRQQPPDRLDPLRGPAVPVDGIADRPHDARSVGSVEAHEEAVLAAHARQQLVVDHRGLAFRLGRERRDMRELAVGQAPDTSKPLVDRVVDPVIRAFQFPAALAARADPGEEDVVARRPVAVHQQGAMEPDRLVDQAGGRSPARIGERRRVQRLQDAVEGIPAVHRRPLPPGRSPVPGRFMQFTARFGRAPMHAGHRRPVAFGRRDGAPEAAWERKRAQHGSMARTVFPASRHVCRAHRRNAWRERVAEAGGASRPGMPGARCCRGMDCPANGIFISRSARLMAGRRRQETRWRRSRAGEGRTLGSGSDERAGAFDGSGANGRTAADCGERASCCPHRLSRTRCTPRVRLRTAERVGAAIAAHCMCRRTCTVRSKWLGTVSGPGVGAGYRRTPWHDAQATRWLASATRRTVRAGKCARRTPGGSRRRGCVAAQEAVGGPCGPGRPRRT